MILFVASVFAAAFFFPNQATAASTWLLDHFGVILALSAAVDAVTLMAVARWRGWAR